MGNGGTGTPCEPPGGGRTDAPSPPAALTHHTSLHHHLEAGAVPGLAGEEHLLLQDPLLVRRVLALDAVTWGRGGDAESPRLGQDFGGRAGAAHILGAPLWEPPAPSCCWHRPGQEHGAGFWGARLGGTAAPGPKSSSTMCKQPQKHPKEPLCLRPATGGHPVPCPRAPPPLSRAPQTLPDRKTRAKILQMSPCRAGGQGNGPKGRQEKGEGWPHSPVCPPPERRHSCQSGRRRLLSIQREKSSP